MVQEVVLLLIGQYSCEFVQLVVRKLALDFSCRKMGRRVGSGVLGLSLEDGKSLNTGSYFLCSLSYCPFLISSPGKGLGVIEQKQFCMCPQVIQERGKATWELITPAWQSQMSSTSEETQNHSKQTYLPLKK